MRKICQRAGANANAITYHFGSKEKLYQEILDRFAALQLEQTQAALSGELRSAEEFEVRLEMFLSQLLETYLNNRETLLIALREFEQLPPGTASEGLRELVEVNHAISGFVNRAKEQHFVREDVDADMVAGTLLDRLINQARYAHTHHQFFGVTTLDNEYRAYWVRSSLSLVLNGLRP